MSREDEPILYFYLITCYYQICFNKLVKRINGLLEAGQIMQNHWVVVDRLSTIAPYTWFSHGSLSCFLVKLFNLLIARFGFWNFPGSALCGLLEVKLDVSFSYHFQTNSQVEHISQFLENYFQHFFSLQHDDWVSLSHWAGFSKMNYSGEFSRALPFFIFYRQHLRLQLPVSSYQLHSPRFL